MPDHLLPLINEALAALPYPKAPEGLYEPIAYGLEGGGKRLRPTLLLLAYKVFGQNPTEALPAALALEIYHNHTLLHDDLMDQAPMRRGRPTVYRKWDANTAILSGDTMLIMAVEQMSRLECRASHEVMALFVRTMKEVCEGQQYDMNFERMADVSMAQYLEMIRLKTAVLPACAAKTGALIGGADEEAAQALYDFAIHLGLAFQIQDDYLDVYGDPKVFGKSIGGDIVCGKKTYLLISALNKTEDQDKARLKALIGDKTIAQDEKIRAVTALYDSLHIAEEAKAAIDRHFALAAQCLDQVKADPERLQPLRDYAESLLGRNV